jgi:hypothetical protein
MNIIKVVFLIAVTIICTNAGAAGVSQTRLFSINYSKLGGYASTPAARWTQSFGASIFSTDGTTFVWNQADAKDYSTPPTVLPNKTWLTIIGPNGAIKSSEKLPTQVLQSQCLGLNYNVTPIKYNVCPSQGIYIKKTALANRYEVSIQQWGMDSAHNYITRGNIYILDARASISDLNRWTLVRYSEAPNFNSYDDSLAGEYTPSNFLFNIDKVTSPIGFTVYSITSK